MIIKSSRKRNQEFLVNMQSSNGTNRSLERKDRIRYLGVILDETISFKYHIAYVCSRTSHGGGSRGRVQGVHTPPEMKPSSSY